MPDKISKTCVLLLTHIADSATYRHYDSLKSQIPADFDLFLLGDNSNNAFTKKKNGTNYFLFTSENLQQLGYPQKTGTRYSDEQRGRNPHHKDFNMPPGNGDLPVMEFFRSHPDYDYYWVVEYDVRFSGNWNDFFTACMASAADLLCTTLTRYPETPDWYHWDSLTLPNKGIDRRDLVRGFFPICRFSNRALAQVHRDYSAGAGGHQECLMPTLLYQAGLVLEDIGGTGEFVRPGNENRFYRNTPGEHDLSPGSFVFRPVMHRTGQEPNMLWHPVKSRRPVRQVMQKFLTRIQRQTSS